MVRLFVYGTLRAGGEASELMGNSIHEQTGVKLENYALYDHGEYPFAIVQMGESVTGDIFLVDTDRLAMLDEYEGDMYNRIEDLTTSLQLYIKADNDTEIFPKIDSGDWIEYKGQNI
jgi:gamma-glutamylcyclotransferase (GGCT)/AIG2-like uncharacterized protein YtfP